MPFLVLSVLIIFGFVFVAPFLLCVLTKKRWTVSSLHAHCAGGTQQNRKFCSCLVVIESFDTFGDGNHERGMCSVHDLQMYTHTQMHVICLA